MERQREEELGLESFNQRIYRPEEGAQGNSRNVRGNKEVRRGLVLMTMAQEAEEITLHHKTTATLLPWPYYFLLKGFFMDVLR